MQSKDNERKTKCGAGTRCQMMQTAIVAEGETSNATGCVTCQRVCHNVCLFEWEKKVFCIKCYKIVVMEEYNYTKTFQQIFEEILCNHDGVKGSAVENQHMLMKQWRNMLTTL